MPINAPTILHDLTFTEVSEHTIPLAKQLALRVYTDTRPHNWKIAALQKGLILVYKGREVIGEGSGFGFPVLISAGETYFSCSAKVTLSKKDKATVLRKEFNMNRISRDTFRNIRLENRKARSILRYASHVYQKQPRLRFLHVFKRAFLRIGISGNFVNCASIGTVNIAYTVHGNLITVHADSSHIKNSNPHKIFLLNEQSTEPFRLYPDSNGSRLVDRELNAWDTVEADYAQLTNLQGTVGFRLWNVQNSVLRRGREFMAGNLDWAGLDYEIDPRNSSFEYQIEILGAEAKE